MIQDTFREEQKAAIASLTVIEESVDPKEAEQRVTQKTVRPKISLYLLKGITLTSLQTFLQLQNLDNLRTIQTNDGYQVTFSLLNGDLESTKLDWEIEATIQSAYLPPLQPFFRHYK